MVDQKIKELRVAKGWTQKELADKLFVTAQAVSRWEKGLVEPSLSTLVEMAKIFNISVDEILGVEPIAKPDEAQIKETVYVVQKEEVKEQPKSGYSKLYSKVNVDEKEEYSYSYKAPSKPESTSYRVTDNKQAQISTPSKEPKRDLSVSKLKELDDLNENRKKSYIWGSVAGVGTLLAAMIFGILFQYPMLMVYGIPVAICAYTLTASICLDNNELIEVVGSIMNFGFIRLPGIIFSLDLEGIFWFLTIKLALWILGGIISAVAFVAALVIGGVCSLVVYPFCLAKNIRDTKKLRGC